VTIPGKSDTMAIKASATPFDFEENSMREIGHFIGGTEVKGGSGRFGDVFVP
jgi:hypothetical protein